MNTKLKTRRTTKGGKVRSVNFGNVTVDIYSREKKANGYIYTTFEVADKSHGKRRMRSCSDIDRAIVEAETIASRLSGAAAMPTKPEAIIAKGLEI